MVALDAIGDDPMPNAVVILRSDDGLDLLGRWHQHLVTDRRKCNNPSGQFILRFTRYTVAATSKRADR